MDIETMDFKGEQLPIAVSLSTINVQGKIKNKFFMINKLNLVGGLPDSVELVNEIDSMWLKVFNYLNENKTESFKTIFVHNLGGFDGVFIFKQLVKLMKSLTQKERYLPPPLKNFSPF